MHCALVLCILYVMYRTEFDHTIGPIPLTKTTVAQNEVALSYRRVRGLYFLAVVFATTIYNIKKHLAPVEMEINKNSIRTK